MKRTTRRRRKLVRLGVTVALALSVGAVPHAGADEDTGDKSFEVANVCEGFGAFQTLPADAAIVRSVGKIPDEFELRGEATGTTFLTVGGFICREVTLDGVAVGRFLYSNVSVPLASHPGGYDIWQFIDLPAVHSRLRQIGIFAPLLKNMSVDIQTLADLPLVSTPISGKAKIPWTQSPYTIKARIVPATPRFGDGVDRCSSDDPQPSVDDECFPSDHWFKGPQGAVYAAHANCNALTAPAAITVSADEGSPLAEMLGAKEVTVPGLWLRASTAVLWDFEEAFDEVPARAERPKCPEIP